jgi:hypothetical protein
MSGIGDASLSFGGSELTSIVTAQTGLPFTPTINTDPAINQWFDVSAFKVPAAFTYGNSGVNAANSGTIVTAGIGRSMQFALRLQM